MTKVHELKDFQDKAVRSIGHELTEALADDTSRRGEKIVLKSPTGSGKTRMVAEIIKDYLADALILVLSPGKGNLHEQTLESLSVSLSNEKNITVKDMSLESFRQNPEPGTVFVANWERLTTQNKKNEYTVHLTRDSENSNLFDHIRQCGNDIPVVVIIDEAHYGASKNAQRIQGFLQDISKTVVESGGKDIITIEVSATPLEIVGKAPRKQYTVDVKEVVEAGLNRIAGVWNADIDNGDLLDKEREAEGREEQLDPEIRKISTTVYADVEELLLDKADQRRKRLNALLKAEGSAYRVLLAVQIPNSNLGLEAQTRVLEFFDERGISVENGRLAIVTAATKAGEVDGLSSPDSPVDVLIYKQALDTGWNCPRAQILVGFRHIRSHVFSLQNIGRFRRTTEGFHYGNPELDKFYVYSNTSNSLQEHIKDQKSEGLDGSSIERDHHADKGKLDRMNNLNLITSRWQRVNQDPISLPTLRKAMLLTVEKYGEEVTSLPLGESDDIRLLTGEYATEDFESEETLREAEKKGSFISAHAKGSRSRLKAEFYEIVKNAVVSTGDYGNNARVAKILSEQILKYFGKTVWKRDGKSLIAPETVDSFLSSSTHKQFLWDFVVDIMMREEVQAYAFRKGRDEEIVPLTNRALSVVNSHVFPPSTYVADVSSRTVPQKFTPAALYGFETDSKERTAQWQESLSNPELRFQDQLIEFLNNNPDYELEVIHKNPPINNGYNFSLGIKIRVKDSDGRDAVSNFFPDYLLVFKNKNMGTSFPVIVEVKDSKKENRTQDPHVKNKVVAAETYMKETGIPFYLVGSGDMGSSILNSKGENTTLDLFKDVVKENLDSGLDIEKVKTSLDMSWMDNLGYIA